MGPNTVPCGIPKAISLWLLIVLLILTNCFLFSKWLWKSEGAGHEYLYHLVWTTERRDLGFCQVYEYSCTRPAVVQTCVNFLHQLSNCVTGRFSGFKYKLKLR